MGDIGVETSEQLRYDWANLSVLHRNTLPPRASFFLYNSESDALSRDVRRAKAHCLSGTWKFHCSNSPLEAPQSFQLPSFDRSTWRDIVVPGMWQLQGFGKGPHYTNVQYPFPVDPPYPPYTDNECGSYVTHFRVPEHLEGHQLRLRFEGVDSGFTVWLNGQEVGYSQGARNPSEFDITSLIRPEGDNLLAVRVYQFTDGSYIEDQDQWWLSGIFRDVFLLGFPRKTRLEDLDLRTVFDSEYRNATLNIHLTLQGHGQVKIRLLDAAQKEIATAATVSKLDGVTELLVPVVEPHKWTAETPYLYDLVVSIDDEVFTAHKIGFRQVEMKDGLLKVNGKRIVIKGANRHEHHPLSGRTVPYDFMRQDLILMKTHNINAIRTCHQPNDSRMYDLADELGFWICDEADLECHGFELIAEAALTPEEKSLPHEQRQRLQRQNAAQWTSDNPEWHDAYVDRAKQLVHRDKLHPSVIIWSLGNEAFYGRNHTAMVDWIRSYDPTRPIHYEQEVDAEHVDMFSRMYPSIENIVDFAKDKSKTKPLVLCEFIHAMGTGPGNIKEYVDAFYNHPTLQGGWVWEWANHGLLTKTADGRSFYGYGGDFGDVPNDYNFVMDGVLNSDHTPNSGLVEYAKAIEPVQLVSSSAHSFKIVNRFDFLSLDYLECVWSLSDENGCSAPAGKIPLPDVRPGDTTELSIPKISDDLAGEAFLNASFVLKKSTPWAQAGHELAFVQIPLATRGSCSGAIPTAAALQTNATSTTLFIKGTKCAWQVDLIHGHLSSWQKAGHSVISHPLQISFYRALTDNDAPRDGKEWKDKLVHLAKIQTRATSWKICADGQVVVDIDQKFAPPVYSWYIHLHTKLVFSRTGEVRLKVAGIPQGQNLPRTLPRIGVTMGLAATFQQVDWFGRFGESYKDMKLSQRVGRHSVSSIDALWTSPDFPQECSNRTDTRWIQIFSRSESLQAHFVQPHTDERHLFDFMACHYDVEDIDQAQHPFALEEKKKDHVILRLDADHHGLGEASCGPKTLDKYELKTVPFEFEIVLQ